MPKKPLPSTGRKDANWVSEAGGLPGYIKRIAEHLYGSGHSVSQSIAIAVSQVKKWASGAGNVKPDTRAKAAAAVAEWETMKAKAKAKKVIAEAARMSYLRMTPMEAEAAGAAFAARLAIVEGMLLSMGGERVPSGAVTASRDLLEGRPVRMVLRSPPARDSEVLDARVRLTREARDLRELAEALGARVVEEKLRPLPHDPDPTRTTQLQNRLSSLGHPLVGDGHYGPKTDAAVRAFQVSQGLKDDGVVGDQTTEMLRSPGEPVGSSLDGEEVAIDPMDEPEGRDNAPAAVLFKGVGVGERGGVQQVRDLQAGLGELGYNVDQDGRFGPQTDQALKRMQRKYGLKADGIFGAKSQRTLKGVQSRNKRVERMQANEQQQSEARLAGRQMAVSLRESNADRVGPEARAKLSPLIRHYMAKPHPFTSCVNDNTKRFGKDRAERVCAVLKDIGTGTTHWRKGGKHLSEAQAVEGALLALAEAGVRESDVPLLEAYLSEQLSGHELSESETRSDRACPACGKAKGRGKCPHCGWASESYKAGRKLAEGRVAEHTRHGARGKLVRVQSYMKKDGRGFDVDAIRAGTPKHIDVNARGDRKLNVWVPGHAYSSHTVYPHTRSVRGQGGMMETRGTGTWRVHDHDGVPSTEQEFDTPEAAVDWAVAKAHESKAAYDESVHDARGGPKVGYDESKRKVR